MIHCGHQSINADDKAAVMEVLSSDFLTQGRHVQKFEQGICTYTKGGHGVAVNSGTSALHIACLALGVGAGDWLWTTPISFVASANCGIYCGAKVDFVDIDSRTWNISVIELAKKLEFSKASSQLPKVLVVVHLCGLPCDMEEIYRLSKEYKFHVIEDACHALGARYADGSPVGNCKYSDITVFSFHPVKAITTGEGGMAVTNNERYAKSMRLYRTHGITRDPSEMAYPSDNPWYYEQIELGFNYRMTDIAAALGTSQLKRLDGFIQKRHKIAATYDAELADLPIQLPFSDENTAAYTGMHIYVVRVKAGNSNEGVISYLREQRIGANLHYIPIHTQPYYRNIGFKPGDFPEAEKYNNDALTLPMFPDMTEADISHVIGALKKLDWQ